MALMILAVFVLLVGCELGSSAGGDPQGDEAVENIDGTWVGVWESETTTENGQVTAIFEQDGTDFSATLTFSGSTCFSAGTTTAGIVGDDCNPLGPCVDLVMSLDFGTTQMAISGVFVSNDNEFEGKYQTDDVCDEHGTIALSRE